MKRGVGGAEAIELGLAERQAGAGDRGGGRGRSGEVAVGDARKGLASGYAVGVVVVVVGDQAFVLPGVAQAPGEGQLVGELEVILGVDRLPILDLAILVVV